jgi:urease accessory protein
MKLSNIRSTLLFGSTIALTVLLPTVAQAHAGHSGGNAGFWSGLMHPFSGLDHILAMVAVGLWAVQLGGKALWTLPLTFVGTMAIGGLLGRLNLPLPLVEPGIIASGIILGGLIVAATRLPLVMSMSLVAFFAIFHGYAHGAEMPQGGSALTYGLGFVIATALLHFIGIASAYGGERLLKAEAVRWAGGVIMLGGCYVLVQAIIGG